MAVGRKQFEFTLRLRIEKSGGWNGVTASVPVAPAGLLSLQAEQANTELQFSTDAGLQLQETQQPQSELQFALPKQGHLKIKWRDKIQASQVDQGLAVKSQGLLDIQEESVRLTWQADFEFRGGRRDSFVLTVPKDYLVERVAGDNVRGWTSQPIQDGQQLDIQLLKAAEQRERILVIISRPNQSMLTQGSTLTAPQIAVPQAMLHQGKQLVRRSRLLEVSAESSEGLSRVDLPAIDAKLLELPDSGPLPVEDFQAYAFSQPNFKLEFAIALAEPQVSVEIQTLVKIAQRQTTLETRLLLNASQRDVHRLQIRLPQSLQLDTPQVEGEFEWSLVDDGNDQTQTLELYIANGKSGDFTIVLSGRLGASGAASDFTLDDINLPRIEVLNVNRQTCTLVIQGDPAYDVRLDSLIGCEMTLLSSVSSWLAENQRQLARAAVRCTQSDYSGVIRLTARTASLSSSWLSNVKVTDRAIEETIFILVRIENAGIREYEFMLPASWAKARIQAPLLRRQSLSSDDDPANPLLRVRLEFQDAMMGNLMVVIENDRLLTAELDRVALPQITQGSIQDRYITLENAGRDELVTSQPTGLRPVDTIRFGDNSAINFLQGTTAEMYSVSGSQQPSLSFQTRSRETVETVGARIGLAQTTMVVDEFGGYRASQEYRVENRTEPYLEIIVPEHAQLWTVTVAGVPTKPAQATAAAAGQVNIRVPLIRTAEGDLDYGVVLKYGGTLAQQDWPRPTRFPFLRTVNIAVELSQVRLYLPQQERWFNFDGSMGRVQSESDLQAGWLAFRTRQLSELTEILGSSEKLYSRARATTNLLALESSLSGLQASRRAAAGTNAELRRQLEANTAALKQAQDQLSKLQGQAAPAAEGLGNRWQVTQLFNSQTNDRSYNVVDELGANFSMTPQPAAAAKPPAAEARAGRPLDFDADWFLRNQLDEYAAKDKSLGNSQLPLPFADAAGKNPQGFSAGKAGEPAMMAGPQPFAGQGESESFADDQGGRPALRPEESPMSADDRLLGDYRQQVERYNQKLQQQAQFDLSYPESGNPQVGGRGLGGGRGDQRGFDFARPIAPSFGLPAQQPNARQMSPEAETATSQLSREVIQPQTNTLQGSVAQASPRFQGGAGLVFPVPQPAYLASLDVELPTRGREYLFTTPGGQVELSARTLTEESIARWQTILALLGLALFTWLAMRFIRRRLGTRSGRRLLLGILLATGITSLIIGWLPVYGILCLIAAAGLLMNRAQA